jgi:hypothetical protein
MANHQLNYQPFNRPTKQSKNQSTDRPDYQTGSKGTLIFPRLHYLFVRGVPCGVDMVRVALIAVIE